MNFKLPKIDKKTGFGLIAIGVLIIIILFIMNNTIKEGLEANDKEIDTSTIKKNILLGIDNLKITEIDNLINNEKDFENKKLFTAISDYKNAKKEKKISDKIINSNNKQKKITDITENTENTKGNTNVESTSINT